MISEGSCDTEDWSNDAENSDLHHRNKLPFYFVFKKYKTVILSCNTVPSTNIGTLDKYEQRQLWK